MSIPVPDYLPDFRPTHVVPRDGLAAWEAPDPALPTVPLDAFLPVELVERSGDWGRVVCSNGWTAWVDARLLVSVPADPPAAGRAAARTADPRPLIARAEDALGRYRRAAEELAAGRLDGETFRRRTRGLRVGMVVDGESVWLYDAEHERWVYCDGSGLRTYAVSAAPRRAVVPDGDGNGDGDEGDEAAVGRPGQGDAASAGHEPTRVVPGLGAGGAAGPPPTQVVNRPSGPAGEGP
ncbi:hypothetical protein [Streptomyces sp. NPDC058855]|uniref:hypothetical protein n=1 Tax=Streptomyces sp. NPDC058855 TaxID=3346651 RepID=UPI00368BEB1A